MQTCLGVLLTTALVLGLLIAPGATSPSPSPSPDRSARVWVPRYTVDINCVKSKPDAKNLLVDLAIKMARQAADIESLGTAHCIGVQAMIIIPFVAVVVQTPAGPRALLFPGNAIGLVQIPVSVLTRNPCGLKRLSQDTYKAIREGQKLWQGTPQHLPRALGCLHRILPERK